MASTTHLRVLTIALALMLVPAVATGPVAASPAEHVVHVGADDPGSPAVPSTIDRFEYLAYYPETLQVRRGDIVNFKWRGDHTVTFHPGGVRQPSLFVPDEVPGDVRIEGVFPSTDDCAVGAGHDDRPPCVLSDSQTYFGAGSSPPSDDYGLRLQVDLPEGTYAYFCTFHPGMRGEIAVVDPAEEIPTAAEVEAARQAQIAADTAAAEAVLENYEAPPPTIVDGDVRWQVQVGGSTPDGRVALMSYLPANLQVAPGDEVEFVVPPQVGGTESHSVSFLPDDLKPTSPGHYFEFRCDVDGTDDGAPGAGVGPTLVFTGCPAGDFEMLFSPWAYEEPVRNPAGVVVGDEPMFDSGIMQTPQEECDDSCDPWTGQPPPSRMEATFPQEGTFTYWCFIHEKRGMSGAITVGGSASR